MSEITGSKHINLFMYERIFTENEYRKAIVRFLEICDAELGTPEYDEALLLSKLMEEYENCSCFERKQLN